MSFRMILYQNNVELNRVDKTDFLIPVYNEDGIMGTLREDTSIVNPVILFEFDGVPQFNYVQIESFNNRFYFVNDIVSVATNLWEVYLSIDVLHTYREQIYNQTCFVERCSSEWNDLLTDNKLVIANGYYVKTIDVPNNLFVENLVPVDDRDANFVLVGTVIGIQDL